MGAYASLEPLSGVIRVFDNGRVYGDPYTWSATCRFIDRRTVEIMGAIKGPTKTEWRAVLSCFAEMGVVAVTYKRYRDERVETKTWLTERK